METQTTTPTPVTKRAPRKTGKKASKPPVADGKKTALKTICGALKIEPKAARRKLRAAGLGFHGKRERWMFTPAQATKVRELLKPAN